MAQVRVEGDKKDEYQFEAAASGYFSVQNNPVGIDVLSRQNATAIIFPYIRSQISLLTAQPGMKPVVIPPMNIAAIASVAERNSEPKKP